MDTKAILDAMIEVAKAAAPLISPSAPATVELGERVVEMVDHAVEHFSSSSADVSDEIADLVMQRDAIELAVSKHVDQTVAHLRGDKA